MIGKDYFIKQAATLLRMARTIQDPAISAELLSKAADLEARAADREGPQPLITPAIQDQPAE